MKSPLRYQITEYDCGPVSLLNALSYLFERKDIPAEVLKVTYLYTLNLCNSEGVFNEGTTFDNLVAVLNYIKENYQETPLAITYEVCLAERVTYQRLKKWVAEDGVMLVKCFLKDEHYVLVTYLDNDYVYLFDPYYLSETYYFGDSEIIMVNSNARYNRKVSLKRFFSETSDDLALGQENERRTILIKRIK